MLILAAPTRAVTGLCRLVVCRLRSRAWLAGADYARRLGFCYVLTTIPVD